MCTLCTTSRSVSSALLCCSSAVRCSVFGVWCLVFVVVALMTTTWCACSTTLLDGVSESSRHDAVANDNINHGGMDGVGTCGEGMVIILTRGWKEETAKVECGRLTDGGGVLACPLACLLACLPCGDAGQL